MTSLADSESYVLFVSLSLAILPLAGVIFSIYLTYSRWLESPFRGLPYPPGPLPKNIISANSSDIPRSRQWHTYANWAKIYGDIIHFRIYGQHTIILNSVEDVRELFEKRAGLYSDRPKNVLVNLTGWDFNVNLMAYGGNWRRHRRLCQQLFRPKASLAYQTIQTQKIHRMLQGLLDYPEHFAAHCKTTVAATIMSIMYGHDVSSSTEDSYVKCLEQSVGMLSDALLPGAAIVNAIPALRYLPAWFPGADFKRSALGVKELTQELQDAPIDFVKKGIVKGTSGPSVVSDLLENCYMQAEYDLIKQVAATSYTAGIEPTASSITTFFLSMAMYPDAQRKAQDEIDRVVGSHRLPNYDDRKSLPYVEALYREVMRWGPASPLNTAHTATEDDIYKGYFIPKGATIIANIWAMTRNEDKYPKPDTFMPERFIDEHGNLNNDDMIFASSFGFGRRICPGRHMASATIWLSIVSILATFNIRKMKDARGNDIPLDAKYTDRIISYPVPFECSITPRSINTKQLIQETVLRDTTATRADEYEMISFTMCSLNDILIQMYDRIGTFDILTTCIRPDEGTKGHPALAKKIDSGDFGEIFSGRLRGNFAKLQPPDSQDVMDRPEVKVQPGPVWKQSLTELSGGQRSLIALSLFMSLLQFKPAPMYILHEIDAPVSYATYWTTIPHAV